MTVTGPTTARQLHCWYLLCVNPGVLGDNPEIPDQVGRSGGRAMQFDFRDVYGSVLMDWFEVQEEEVRNLLHPDFQHLPVYNPVAQSQCRRSPEL